MESLQFFFENEEKGKNVKKGKVERGLITWRTKIGKEKKCFFERKMKKSDFWGKGDFWQRNFETAEKGNFTRRFIDTRRNLSTLAALFFDLLKPVFRHTKA